MNLPAEQLIILTTGRLSLPSLLLILCLFITFSCCVSPQTHQMKTRQFWLQQVRASSKAPSVCSVSSSSDSDCKNIERR